MTGRRIYRVALDTPEGFHTLDCGEEEHIWDAAAVNGIVLPFVLIFMLLLVNKKSLMGEYVNSRFFNVIAWATTVIMIGLTVAWFWTLRVGQ